MCFENYEKSLQPSKTFAEAIEAEYAGLAHESNVEDTEFSPRAPWQPKHLRDNCKYGCSLCRISVARSHHWQMPVHVSGLVGRHRILQTTFFKDAQENYEAADTAKGSSMSSGSHCLTTQLLLYADLNCQKARCLNAVDGLPMAVSPAPP